MSINHITSLSNQFEFDYIIAMIVQKTKLNAPAKMCSRFFSVQLIYSNDSCLRFAGNVCLHSLGNPMSAIQEYH